MHFQIKGRRVHVEQQPIILVLLCLAWAIYYYFSTVAQPDEGPESVLFIKPLIIIMAISALFTIATAVKIAPAPQETEKPIDRGILHPQRMVFVLSLFVYAAVLPYFGYLLPSLIYLVGMCLYLGLRNFWILLGLVVGYTALLWMGFKNLMGVPIPIWPSFFL